METMANFYSCPSNGLSEGHASESTSEPSEQEEALRPWYSTFTGCCIVGKKWKKVLVHLQCGEQIVMEGIYVVKPVIGSVDILGYRLDNGEKKPVFSPRHRARLALSCGVHALSQVGPNCKVCGCVTYTDEAKKLQETYFLTDQQVASLYIRPGWHGVVLELSSFLTPLPNVLVHCEILSLYMNLLPMDNNAEEYSSTTPRYTSDMQASFHLPYNSENKRINTPELAENNAKGKFLVNSETVSSSHVANHEATAQQDKSAASLVDPSSAGEGASAMRSCDVNECYLALNGAKPILASMEPSHIVNVPSSWDENVDDILERVQTGELMWTYEHGKHPLRPGLRILVVGDRGVGKSTLVRHLVNSLLNFAKSTNQPQPDDDSSKNGNQRKRKRSTAADLASESRKKNTKRTGTPAPKEDKCVTKSVCLLDLDCGQPEISLPGSVSVRRVTEPLLGPALVYGNSSLRSHTEMAASLRKLRTRKAYLNQLRNNLYPLSHDTLKPGSRRKEGSSTDDSSEVRAKSSPTLGELTMLQEIQEMVEELESETLVPRGRIVTKELLIGSTSPLHRIPEFLATVEELTEAVEKEHSNEPLVVNTMGWTRNEGMLLLGEILKIVEPVFVLHVTTDRNEDLSSKFMNEFHDSNGYELLSELSKIEPLSRVYRFDYKYFQVHSGNRMRLLPWGKFNFLRPSRLDLRILSVIAYLSSLWTSCSPDNFHRSMRQCKCLSFASVGVHSLDREDVFFGWPGADVAFELVSLCRVDAKRLFKVADNLPLRYFPPGKAAKPEDDTKQEEDKKVITLPVVFHFLQKHSRIPLPENVCVRPLQPFIIPDARQHYRALTQDSERSTHRLPVLGWGVLVSVDRAAGAFKVLTPVSESDLEKVNLVVRSQLELPDSLRSVIVNSNF